MLQLPDKWIPVTNRYPTKEDTNEETYHEVMVLDTSTNRPKFVKWFEVKHYKWYTHWTTIPKLPPKEERKY